MIITTRKPNEKHSLCQYSVVFVPVNFSPDEGVSRIYNFSKTDTIILQFNFQLGREDLNVHRLKRF